MKSANTSHLSGFKSVAFLTVLATTLVSSVARYASAQTGWAVGGKTKILYYDGTSWNYQEPDKKNDPGADLLAVHSADGNTACAVGGIATAGPFKDQGTILCTNTAGATWTAIRSGVNQRLNGIYFSDKDHIWVVGDAGTVLYSDNGGKSFKKPLTKMVATQANLYGVAFFTKNQPNSHGCIVGDLDGGKPFVEWLADGKEWHRSTRPPNVNFAATSVSFRTIPATETATGSLVGWVVGKGTFGAWESTDGGKEWRSKGPMDGKNPWDGDLLAVQVLSKTNVWAGGVELLRTTNEGGVWTPIPIGQYATTVRGIAFTDTRTGWIVAVYGVGGGGAGAIYKTTNGDADKVKWTLDKVAGGQLLYGIVMVPPREQVQIKLNLLAMPSYGSSGITHHSIEATGLPEGNINPANILVQLATECSGTASGGTSATSIVSGSGDIKLVSFQLPGGLEPGQYFVSISDSEEGDADFESSNCAVVNVVQ